MSANELLVQSAVTLLATGRAEQASEAISMASQLIAEVERAIEAREGRAKKKGKKTRKGGQAKAKSKRKKLKPLPIRALRVLERLKVVDADQAVDAQKLQGKVCEAHLFSAKGCGEATVRQIATWCKAQGVILERECATFTESWLTSRCDEG